MLYMFSKYAHVKGFDLSNSLICYSMEFFNPLTYALYPLTGYLPPNKIPQPPNKKLFALCAIHNVLALAFKTQYASALPHNTLHVHIATTTKFRSSNIMDQ